MEAHARGRAFCVVEACFVDDGQLQALRIIGKQSRISAIFREAMVRVEAVAATPFWAPRRRHQAPRTIVAVVVFARMASQTSAFLQPAIAAISSCHRPEAAATEITSRSIPPSPPLFCLYSMSDDWSNFQAMDDDDEIVFGTTLDKTDYAVEDDSPEAKAAVGSSLQAPEIERDAEPIQAPAGTCLCVGL